MINEYPATDDAKYNSVSENGKKDIFRFQSFGFTDIFDYSSFFDSDEDHPALAIKLRGRYDDAGDAIQAIIIVDGFEYEADVVAPDGYFNGAFAEYTFYWLTNPATLDSWLPEELMGTAGSGNLQYVGYHSGSNATGERKVSRMYVVSYPYTQAAFIANGDGAIQWDRSGNSYNYQNVIIIDSHDYYNYTDVANEMDQFTFTTINDTTLEPYTIPADSDITWIWGGVQAIAGDEASYKMKVVIWIDGEPYTSDAPQYGKLPNSWHDVLGLSGIAGWTENPKTSNPWTADDVRGIGSDAITHIGYNQANNSHETDIAFVEIILALYPNDEPA